MKKALKEGLTPGAGCADKKMVLQQISLNVIGLINFEFL
jgi:hypothetical protein